MQSQNDYVCKSGKCNHYLSVNLNFEAKILYHFDFVFLEKIFKAFQDAHEVCNIHQYHLGCGILKMVGPKNSQ